MKDSRFIYALALIVLVAYAPFFLSKKTPPVGVQDQGISLSGSDSSAVAPEPIPTADTTPASTPLVSRSAEPLDSLQAEVPEDTVVIRSGLYRYGLSTRGGRLLSAQVLRYRSLAPGAQDDTLEMVPEGDPLLSTRFTVGTDTLKLDNVVFEASADSLDVVTDPATLTMRGTVGGHPVELTWKFVPDDYRFEVSGKLGGLATTGGTVLIRLGDGLADTEADDNENHRESGVVTKAEKTRVTRFNQLKPSEKVALGGPFEWVAVKSKYFVTALFVGSEQSQPGYVVPLTTAEVLGGAASPKSSGGFLGFGGGAGRPTRGEVMTTLSLPASGQFGYRIYLGPMEYDRLARMGHDFDDVNPYGFAFIRPIVRPFAVGIRAVFLWMHNTLGIGFGVVIVLFGIMVRILLWPLNQKAMRSMTGMQAIQPELKAIQERYKEDPARLQQEMFKLYKEHGVNPLGGCWPMLIPYPLLIAVFFVLQSTIELRGVPFLWLADLSRADSTYMIPILMAASMFAISWVSQRSMPANPQAKMMMYIMPAVMLVLFARFASGLNLYYLVQNLASLPQQLLINRERVKLVNDKSSSKGKVEVRTR